MLWTVCWLSVLRAVEVWLSEEVRLAASCTRVARVASSEGLLARVDQSCQNWVSWDDIPVVEGSGKFPCTDWRPACWAVEHALVRLAGVALLLEVLVAETLDALHLDAVAGQRAGTVVKAHVLDRTDGAELDLFIDVARRAGVGHVLAHRVHGRLLSLQPGEPNGEV